MIDASVVPAIFIVLWLLLAIGYAVFTTITVKKVKKQLTEMGYTEEQQKLILVRNIFPPKFPRN